jgi:chromosome segregation ATPase
LTGESASGKAQAMAPDDPIPPDDEVRAAALADEVRQLKELLIGMQAELSPAMQSSLRERSDELQRLSGELAVRDEEASRLRRQLAEAEARARDLEREVERWRDAALSGVEAVAEKARAAVARYERETAELISGLTTARAQAQAVALARDQALQEVERRKARIRVLRAKVMQRERRRIEMMQSPSWQVTAPLRWAPKAMHELLRRGARLRRRLLKR